MAASFASLGIKIDARDVKAANEALDKFSAASKNAEQASKANEAQSVKTNLSYEKTILKLTESSSAYNHVIAASKGYTSAQIAAISAAERYAQSLKTAQSYQSDHNKTVQRATEIYVDMVNKLKMTDVEYKNHQLSLKGLTSAQIAHINALESEKRTANEAAIAQQKLAQQRHAANEAFSSKMSAGSQVNPYSNIISGGMSQAGRMALIAAIEKEAELAEPKVNKLTSSISTLALRYASIGAAIGVGKLMLDTVEQVQNLEMRLKGLTTSAQDYANTESYLSSISKEHHKDVIEMSNSYARLLVIEQSGIITREQSKSILEGLSNAQSKTGASATDLKMSMVGMTQALSQGTLQWEEMKQVTDPIPGLMLKIANAAGYTGESAIGDFKKVVSAGQVTSQMFGEILPKAFAQYEGAASAASNNLTAKYADVKNSWTELMKVLDQPVEGTVSPVLDAVSATLDTIAEKLGVVIDQYNKMEEIKSRGMRSPDYVPPKPKGEQNKAENDARLKEQERINGLLADTEDWYTEIVIKDEQDQAKAVHEKNVKLQHEAESEAKRLKNEAENHSKKISEILNGLQGEHEASGLLGRSKEKEIEMRKLLKDAVGEEYNAIKLSVDQKYQDLANEDFMKAKNAEIDKYNQLTMSAKQYYEWKLKIDHPDYSQEKVSELTGLNTRNIETETKIKGIEEARKEIESYNNELDKSNDKMSDFGKISSSVFDGALGGINTLAGALSNMVDIHEEINKKISDEVKKREELANKPVGSFADIQARDSAIEKSLKKEKSLEQDKVSASLSGTRQIIAATAKMFDEKSSAAKTLHNIEMGIAVAQMAMDAVRMARTFGNIAVDIAAGAAKMFGQSGWGGFAGVAAMGAVMAGLGYAFSGSGGGNGTPPEYSKDTGTVLGDPTAKSESINKTYQLLKDIHADEYATLRSIDRGISDLHSGITDVITRLFQAGGLKDFAKMPVSSNSLGGIGGAIQMGAMLGSGGLAKFDPIANKVLGFLFGGKTTSTVTAQGISTGATSIADIMAGGNLSAQQFATIETTRKGGLFGKTKTSYNQQYASLDEATQDSLNNVFKSMGNTMLDLADSIGFGLSDRVKNYIIPSLTVDLKGLNGEDAAKKLNGVISAALDTMSTAVFGSILKQYQQLGEGMLETAVRIVAEVAVVKDALGKSGLSIAGDAIAISDALVQAAGGLKEFQKAFDDYYQKFYTDAERNVFLQGNLSNRLSELNTVLPETREGYRKLVESLNVNNEADAQRYSLLIKLSSAADEYYGILEDQSAKATQLAQQQRALDIQYMELSGNALGALVEKRKDELAAMDESLRFGQQVVWLLQDFDKSSKAAADEAKKNVTTAMSILQKAVAEEKNLIKNKYDDLIKIAQSSLDALQNVISNAFSVLQKSVSTENKRITDEYNLAVKNTQLSIDNLSESVSSLQNISNALKSALASTEISGGDAQRRIDAQNVIFNSLKSGVLPDQDVLNNALSTIAKPSESLFSSKIDYQRDFFKTTIAMSDLSDMAEKQLNKQKTQLDIAQEQLDLMKVSYDKQIADLEMILTKAQEQVDAANGTTIAVMTVREAQDNLNLATSIAGKQQLDVFSAQIEAYKAASANEIARLDGVLATAQTQIDAANGTTQAVMSVEGAIINLGTAITAQKEQAAKAQAELAARLSAIATAQEAVKRESAAKQAYNAASAQAANAAAAVSAAQSKAASDAANARAAAANAAALARPSAAPTTWQNGQSGNAVWEQVLSQFNAWHVSYAGKPMDRPWGADSDAWGAYQGLVAKYNAINASAAQSAAASAASLAHIATASAALIPQLQSAYDIDQTAALQANYAYLTATNYANAAKSAIPGFAIGINEVPYDMTANIHAGERILPAADNKELMMRLSEPRDSGSNEVAAEIRRLREEVALLRAEARATASNTNKSAKLLERVIPSGDAVEVRVVV